jgi:hypothetical protein
MDEPQTISRDEMAMELAKSMVEQRDIMRSVLKETLRSAKMGHIREAGRTKCPRAGEIRGSLQRFPRAIDLASCPVERGGTWHTHVTEDEIQNPTNSLPDMANVMFGLIDASVVVGTQTADVIVAPEDREAGERAFRNAIGADVSEPKELSAAIQAGRIAPGAARVRAREKFPGLVYTVETGFRDLDAQVRSIDDSVWAVPPVSGEGEAVAGNGYAPTAFAPHSIEAAADMANGAVDGFGLKNLLVSQAVGTVVGNVVDKALFE